MHEILGESLSCLSYTHSYLLWYPWS